MNNPNLSKLNDGIQSVVTTVLRGFKKNSDPLDIQLGIWGTAGAGKTTYLGRLYTELPKLKSRLTSAGVVPISKRTPQKLDKSVPPTCCCCKALL